MTNRAAPALPAAPSSGPSATARGILFMLAAVLTFTAMDAVAKALIGRFDTIQVVWARYSLQTLLVAGLHYRRLPQLVRTAHPWLQILRSACQLGSTAFFFASLRYIGLAESTAISDLSPVLITAAAAILLHERIGPRRLMGIFAALVGALIIIRPGTSVFTPAALLPLAGALSYTGFAIITRKVGHSESVWTSMLYTTMVGTLVTTAALPAVWQPVAGMDLVLFALIGTMGLLGQFFLIRAFTLAEASVVAPFGQSDILFATLWGMFVFDEFPDFWTRIGALVIVGAGLYVWHRETRAGRAKT